MTSSVKLSKVMASSNDDMISRVNSSLAEFSDPESAAYFNLSSFGCSLPSSQFSASLTQAMNISSDS